MNLLAILTFSGILFGILLKKLAKEEIKQGQKYFKVMIRICLVIISLILMYNLKISWTIIPGAVIAYFLAFEYLYLGLSYIILDNFLLYTILFIFGLPYGTLLKDNKEILKELLLFLLPLILLINNINIQFETEIASFAVGSLLSRAIRWK